MSKNINTSNFVGTKKNKGKSNGFKSLQQEVKRKQKAEEIIKAIQKIQNESKQKKETQFKPKHFKTCANSDRNLKAEMDCDEQANIDAFDELCLQEMEEAFEVYLDWSRRQQEEREREFELEQSNFEEYQNWAARLDEEREREFVLSQSNAKDLSLLTIPKLVRQTNRPQDFYMSSSEEPLISNADIQTLHYCETCSDFICDCKRTQICWNPHCGNMVVNGMCYDCIMEHHRQKEQLIKEAQDIEDQERRKETNEAIYDYVCENSSDDSYTEEFEPIVPKHLELESRIYNLETQLSAAQETIFQLLGGLFNQETQKQILDAHMKFLYTGRTFTDEEIEQSRWPTTRQGDENAERIQKLEENIDVLVKKLKKGKPLHRFYRNFRK